MITYMQLIALQKALGHLLARVYTLAKMFHFLFHFLIFVEKQPKILPFKTDFAFGMLSAVHSKGKEEIYQMINTRMTDSVDRNKGFAKILADLYNLDTPAGQLFGGTHTTLGFSSAMSKRVAVIERDSKIYWPILWLILSGVKA